MYEYVHIYIYVYICTVCVCACMYIYTTCQHVTHNPKMANLRDPIGIVRDCGTQCSMSQVFSNSNHHRAPASAVRVHKKSTHADWRGWGRPTNLDQFGTRSLGVPFFLVWLLTILTLNPKPRAGVKEGLFGNPPSQLHIVSAYRASQ